MPYKYRDLMWSEMTDRQKTLAGSKSEHKAAKKAHEERQSSPTPSPTPAPSPTPTPTPSASTPTPTPSASTAVERTQNWADLSKDERRDSGMTKKEFNRQDTVNTSAPQNSSTSSTQSDPLESKYSEMDDDYRSSTTKAVHKQARKDAGTYTNDRLESYNVDSLDDFDITKTGRGRKTGANRLSVGELNRLHAAGFSKEEIANRAMTGAWAGSKKGTKAQALLLSLIHISEPTRPY